MFKKIIIEKITRETFPEYVQDVLSSAILGYIIIVFSDIFYIYSKTGFGLSHSFGVILFAVLYALGVAFPIKNEMTQINTIYNICLPAAVVMLVNIAGLHSGRRFVCVFLMVVLVFTIYDIIHYIKKYKHIILGRYVYWFVWNRFRRDISISAIIVVALYWILLVIGIIVFI